MDLQQIGKQLKAARKIKGYSKYRIAKDNGLSPSTITTMEAGMTGYTINALLAYCKAVDIEIRLYII